MPDETIAHTFIRRWAALGPRTLLTSILGAALLAAGCADERTDRPDSDSGVFVGQPGDDGGTDDGGVGDGSAPKLDAPPAVLAPPAPVALAVVGGDFVTTAVSLVSPGGVLVRDDCIDSATGAAGQLSLTLSGDVTLPSQPQRGNELWLIDRGNADLTVVDPATCVVKRQLSVSTGFRSNPHDVVVVSDTKAYVTRFEKNLAPTNANSGGDDLLVIDPRAGAIAGRVSLSTYAAPVAGAAIQARPDRAVIAAGRVLVTLASQDASFAATGEGRVVVIDPATDQVTGVVAIPGLTSCSAMDVMPGSSTVLVACSGSFGDVDQPLHSGVVLIDAAASPPSVSRVISAQAFGRPVNFSWVVAAGPTRAYAGTLGAFANPAAGTSALPDGVFQLDPSTGRTTQLALAGAFDLGRASGGDGRLFVPDATASAPVVRVFEAAAGADPIQTGAFNPDPARSLPPREIAWY